MMNTLRLCFHRVRLHLLLLPGVVLALLCASFLTPLSAGGLNDFLKKGKDTKTENPQPAPSKDNDRATPNQNSDNGVDLWRKQRRDPTP
ncbi:MAG TPA: hypothetical protein VHR86_00655, partial [Armatimonadota bacterium]|nr:hypothetical protein [Armatimonadota bacterium]